MSRISYECRRDIVFCQMLPALVSAFVSTLQSHIRSRTFFSQLYKIGFLAHFESLLSTSGRELCMLEDFRVAVHDAQQVVFQV